jgi:hypothetical protein
MITNIFSQNPLYQSPSFSIYPEKVVQGNFEAKAISPKHLVSNYKSPSNENQSTEIIFKFAINGRDNEMISGKDHHFIVDISSKVNDTPIINFGNQLIQKPTDNQVLAPNTVMKFSVDLREVLQQFDEKGFYLTCNGDKIYKDDFKGVYIAGGTAPLIWDFDNLVNNPDLKMKDDDNDGIYENTVVLNKLSDEKHTESEWKLSKDISAFPQYQSDYVLSDAIYNLSIEEMLDAIEDDSTFRTGKEWSGVWTRDISYSIILSMAYLQPKVAMNSLLRKVSKSKRIIQDTGTGGAWPVSTDRMIWAVAAWEVYKATGDKDWLEEAFQIIKNSIEDDLQNVYDPETGLVKGESSFLDWREQTYPKWMQAADIFESECLGTNAVHFQANIILSKMATVLNQNQCATKHLLIAEKIMSGINQYLWLPDKGYYAQYLYGRNFKSVSPRSEALGEALCVLFGIADPPRARQIISSTPVTSFGIPCIYPEIPLIPPYHNNAVWPFVQSYWLWAAAKSENEQSVIESIGAIYRPSALFLTNKENFVAESGDYNGTQINSSIMLWSLSGNISIVHKVLFGIIFEDNKLKFSPFVPEVMKGKRTLSNFKYRNAVLDIELQGYGNKIVSFEVDGKMMSEFEIPETIEGNHKIKIVLNNQTPLVSATNQQEVVFTLPAPAVRLENQELLWQPFANATDYLVYANGQLVERTKRTNFQVKPGMLIEYQVIALDKNNVESFASEPVIVIDSKYLQILPAEDAAEKATHAFKGFTGDGFIETSKTKNQQIQFKVNAEVDGLYAIDFRYANGNGPTNTENKCAIRTLVVDKIPVSAIVFPQRGKEEWSNWGFSNASRVYLTKGEHLISISLEKANNNMNGEINQAMIDFMRVQLLK